MANGNLDRLVQARVVPAPEQLTDAERRVIDGLSEEEVSTLVGIRRKLSAEVGADSPAASLGDEDPELDLKSNFVV
ncbi:MAG TPA: aroma-sacti cluster domain-containing protein [Thermoanaerobaculia bacterium]|jgi:hypothetical protein